MSKEKLIKAKYKGLSSEECKGIIISFMNYSAYDRLIWKKIDDYLAPFNGWWNEYIADEEDFKRENDNE